jgi:hypothetical protein
MGPGEIVNTRITLAIVMAAALPAAASAQTSVPTRTDDVRRIDQIRVMEGTLIGSVSLAANQVAREVQSRTPGANLFTGEARAKGFTLDGYGAFFYVEIPALDLNLVLSMETLERAAQRRGESNSGPTRANQVSDVQSAADDALRNVAADDPGQKYRDAVKRCLIDAMLDHSKSMDLGPDEWLTVAARGSESGLIPGEIYQLKTLELKVKGSDLAEFLAGRLSRDEARQKVAVRQF